MIEQIKSDGVIFKQRFGGSKAWKYEDFENRKISKDNKLLDEKRCFQYIGDLVLDQNSLFQQVSSLACVLHPYFESQANMTEVKHSIDTKKTLHRREEIVRLVAEQGKASVEELSARYTVSSVTIRNDLNHLNKKGLLIRSRGGAIACKINTIELPLQEKHHKNLDIKQKISQMAASLIKDGDTVILDSGTTTQEIARRLDRHKDLIVMTNGLNVANELSRHETIDMMMTGGHYRQKSMSFYGAQAEESLKQLRFDKVFLGVDGYDIEAGITTHFDPEARLNRLMCQSSREVIVVTDASKFEQRGFQVILPFDQVDTLITDKGIPKRYLDELKRKGVNVIIVDE